MFAAAAAVIIDNLFCRTLSAVMYCGSATVWKNLSRLSRDDRGGGGGGGGDGGAETSLCKLSFDVTSFETTFAGLRNV